MNKNDRQFLAQEIRTRYMEKKTSELDALCALDRRVKRPPTLFAYLFGSLGAIIMGSGMSLIMTDIATTLGLADPMLPGIALGLFGLLIAALTYPFYRAILARRRAKYAKEILSLSDTILNEGKEA